MSRIQQGDRIRLQTFGWLEITDPTDEDYPLLRALTKGGIATARRVIVEPGPWTDHVTVEVEHKGRTMVLWEPYLEVVPRPCNCPSD